MTPCQQLSTPHATTITTLFVTNFYFFPSMYFISNHIIMASCIKESEHHTIKVHWEGRPHSTSAQQHTCQRFFSICYLFLNWLLNWQSQSFFFLYLSHYSKLISKLYHYLSQYFQFIRSTKFRLILKFTHLGF